MENFTGLIIWYSSYSKEDWFHMVIVHYYELKPHIPIILTMQLKLNLWQIEGAISIKTAIKYPHLKYYISILFSIQL